MIVGTFDQWNGKCDESAPQSSRLRTVTHDRPHPPLPCAQRLYGAVDVMPVSPVVVGPACVAVAPPVSRHKKGEWDAANGPALTCLDIYTRHPRLLFPAHARATLDHDVADDRVPSVAVVPIVSAVVPARSIALLPIQRVSQSPHP